MLRIVRLNDCAVTRTVASRGLTLLVVALAAGGCSAGFDRLGPLNYSGGPAPTGSAPLLPPEPMRQQRGYAPPPADYRSEERADDRAAPRSDYRPDYRPEGRSEYRPDDPPAYRPPYGDRRSAAPPAPRGDDAVRVAGLPEPYDRSATPDRSSQIRQSPRVAPFEATRAPPPPPRAAIDPPAAAAPASGDTVEVRPGDTLFAISKAHGVSMSELMRINGLSGPQLKVGQTLMLPADRRRPRGVARLPEPAPTPYVPPTPAPTSAPPLATAPAPSSYEPIVPPLVETPPPRPAPIATPAPPPVAAPAATAARDEQSGWTGTYKVERGDSLYSIARRHGVRLNDLERVNEITNPRKVMPGTVLKVPQAGEASRVARVTPQPTATPPVATPAPRTAEAPAPAPESSGPPPVRPTILNAPEATPSQERTRIAALERNPGTMEQPRTGGAAPSTATDAPQRDAALPPSKAAPPTAKFRWPARGKVIAGFSPQPGATQNEGINISLPRGTPIHAAESGTVTYAADDVQGYGNLILIHHADGWTTVYAHNDATLVKNGETVRRGQIIAKAGATGSVSQPQLHFQVRRGTTLVDPVEYLER